MEIRYLQSIDSTQTYLKNYIKEHGFSHNLCIATQEQTLGIGSRGNSWSGVKGNLFFSFVLDKKELPKDLPVQSFSIYFSFLLKEFLKNLGSKVWLKWPNDFYIEDKKIGGTITNLQGDLVYCGIGLNLQYVDMEYGYLDISIDPKKVLEEYFLIVWEKKLWKDIFSKYLLEFELSRKFQTTIRDQKVSLQNAALNEDGSISINNEKVFSLR